MPAPCARRWIRRGPTMSAIRLAGGLAERRIIGAQQVSVIIGQRPVAHFGVTQVCGEEHDLHHARRRDGSCTCCMPTTGVIGAHREADVARSAVGVGSGRRDRRGHCSRSSAAAAGGAGPSVSRAAMQTSQARVHVIGDLDAQKSSAAYAREDPVWDREQRSCWGRRTAAAPGRRRGRKMASSPTPRRQRGAAAVSRRRIHAPLDTPPSMAKARP